MRAMRPASLPAGVVVDASRARPAPEWTVERWFNAPTGVGSGEGGAFGLGALKGRVVVLHAFQMLCPGCVAHGLPQAQRIRAQFDPAEVAVVGLHSVFEHHDAMRPVSLAAFLHEYRVDFPVGVDASATAPGVAVPQTMARYEMRGTPTLVLIDRAGRLRLHTFGRPDDLAVGAAIGRLLSEPAAGSECSDEGCSDQGCSDQGCRIA